MKTCPITSAFKSFGLVKLSCLAALITNSTFGQTLTNGFDQPGTLVLGTTNSYTFYATNGDVIILRVGAPFRPLITLHAPNGTALNAASGSGSSSVDAATMPITVATNGLFTVRASSYYGNGSGAYSLSLARIPALYEASPTDQGGLMTEWRGSFGHKLTW